MLKRSIFASAIVLALLPTVVGCSGAAEDDKKSGLNEKEPSKKKKPADDTSGEASGENPGETEGPTGNPVTPPPAPAAAPMIYAHTKDTLYTFDSGEKKLTEVGKLNCLPSATDRLLDIAVDGKGTIFGTTDAAFLAINPKDATCTRIVAKTGLPNSLSFVPTGTLDAAKDALVGYAFDTGGDAVKYVRIDTTDGKMTEIGNLNAPNATVKYVSSGDIFSVAAAGNKTYVTVHKMDVSGSSDELAEIDPKTGRIKTVVGNTLQDNIYGLAYWGGKAYGFSDDGNVTEINVANGVSNIITTLKKDNVAVPWFGAGVTTEAPTTPTK